VGRLQGNRMRNMSFTGHIEYGKDVKYVQSLADKPEVKGSLDKPRRTWGDIKVNL
jgi:hypothetical protein